MNWNRLLVLFLGSLVGVLVVLPVSAQELTEGIAYTLQLTDSDNISNGMVICTVEDNLFSLCAVPYSPSMQAVVADTPVAALETQDIEGGRLVVTTGKVRVLATNGNGEIQAGDFVTTSENPGVAMKSAENGYVLGTALESLVDTDENGLGGVLVAMNIHFEAGISNTRSNLIQVLRSGLSIPLFEPLSSLRYIIAALLVLFSFVLGFIVFGRMAQAGVEAMGRNPLASRMIQTSVLTNIIVTVVIVLAGLFSAYLILIL